MLLSLLGPAVLTAGAGHHWRDTSPTMEVADVAATVGAGEGEGEGVEGEGGEEGGGGGTGDPLAMGEVVVVVAEDPI